MHRPPLSALLLLSLPAAHAGLSDLANWTLLEDPPSPFFSAISGSSEVTLFAGDGSIPSGTDIGYQSTNANTPDDSTAGFYFDRSRDFTVAIDFALSFGPGPQGTMGLGFGIGEDAAGRNSAGVAILTTDGGFVFPALVFAAAARVDDTTLSPQPIFVAASLEGSLYALYEASSGAVTLGASGTPSPDPDVPEGTATFAGPDLAAWQGDRLLLSFFIRSADPPWQGGTATAVFTNFRVLSGTPIPLAVVPVIESVTRTGDTLSLGFRGTPLASYFLVGGPTPEAFPDDLTADPGTSVVETPPGSGLFQATLDVDGKGPDYFVRVTGEAPSAN